MAGDFYIQVKGMDKVEKALDKFPREIAIYIGRAGGEAANRVIFDTQGIKKYPPATAANAPPTPYYIRGRGTQTAHGNKGNSERYGTQWYTKRDLAQYTTTIGNRASYAHWLTWDDQARAMERIGWRKIKDVVEEKMDNITKVYQAWVDKLIKDLGL